MRSLVWITISALAALWGYFGVQIADRDFASPAYVAPDGVELSAPTLNNEGVSMFRLRRYGDAAAYFDRARAFAPTQTVYATNLLRAENRRHRDAWLRALVPGSAVAVLVFMALAVTRARRRGRRRRVLERLRVRNDAWIDVAPGVDEAELALRFNEPLEGVVRDHPLTIVWSSSRHGKHMKSKPPVEVDGTKARVLLNRERIARLRRYPGDWKGFLYLGKTQVGEAVARVG